MKSRGAKFVGAAIAASCLVWAGAASAAPLLSEDFSGAVPGPTGSGPIGGTQFTVTQDNVDVVGVLNGSFFTCVDNPAGNCLDLVGESGGGAIQSIPSFNLLAGQTYELTFGEVLQGYAAGSPATTQVRIALGSLSQDETFDGGVITHPTLSFTPLVNETSAALSFTTLTAPDSVHGAVLDDIVLSTVGVPEPSAWALLLLGVGAVGGALRGRRSRKLIACG